MATITLRAEKGTPLTFEEVDNNFNAINLELIALAASAAQRGAITNVDIADTAAIADSKIATIATAGKVANSATSAATANTANAIVLRDANGNFQAGTITATLSGNANTATAFSGNRTITLTGAVTGNVSSTFSGDISLSTTLASGSVTNASIANNAAIADTKLATISTADKVSASALNIDGASDIGQAIPDTALLLLDRSGTGENRKSSVTRLPAYVFSKISGDLTIDSTGVATISPAGQVDAADVFAQVSGDITISPLGAATIGAGAIFNSDINESAAISHGKLASLLAGWIIVGNNSNVPTATPVTGDIELSSSGSMTLKPGTIVNDDISSSANIAYSKLAPLAPGYFLVGSGASVPQGVLISGDITVNGSGTATLKQSLALTGSPTADTPSTTDSSNRLATTAYVVSRIANDAPTKSGVGATGTWGINISGNASTATSATNWNSIPAGTVMLFQQTNAPTGWTKLTSHDNKALRVVSGSAGSGGSSGFTSVFTSRTPTGWVGVTGTVGSTTAGGSVSVSGSVGATTLSLTQIPSHTHNSLYPFFVSGAQNGSGSSSAQGTTAQTTSAAGGSDSHTHSWSGSASFSGSLHNHSFSGSGTFTGTAMDFSVAYVDVIFASKN